MSKHVFKSPRKAEDKTVVTRIGAVIWTRTRYTGMVLTYLRAVSKKMGLRSIEDIPDETLREVGATVRRKEYGTISIDVQIPDPQTAKQRLGIVTSFRRKNRDLVHKLRKQGGRRNFFQCFAKGAEFTDMHCMDENIMGASNVTVTPKKRF